MQYLLHSFLFFKINTQTLEKVAFRTALPIKVEWTEVQQILGGHRPVISATNDCYRFPLRCLTV